MAVNIARCEAMARVRWCSYFRKHPYATPRGPVIQKVQFTATEVAPDRDAVLEHQGIPVGTSVKDHIEELYQQAVELLAETISPAGIMCDISAEDFAGVYEGDGRNDGKTPVGDMFARADHLALFVVTLGERTCSEITERFAANDFAIACMLDAAASIAADQLAETIEGRFGQELADRGWTPDHGGVLRYSPGYCGWHISGQKKLFEFLDPGKIGVTLRDSFLMEPLKSVSGVIIAGPREIHKFPINFGFCKQCKTRSCRQRLRELYAS